MLYSPVSYSSKPSWTSGALVDDDRVDQSSLEFDGCVLVADRRGERCASGPVLLDLALADLVGEVLVLILREGGVDTVVELTGRSVVNVLKHRGESRPGLAEPVVDDRVVHRVAREAVELVHDHEVHVLVALDVGDHFHEPRPVTGLGGLGQVDVLAYHRRSEIGCLASARLPPCIC
jgi:hypothetical protein